jgi:ribosomal protein S18 acetylase RimI-like enzyme
MSAQDVLDNPIWYSLQGKHRDLGSHSAKAVAYQRRVSPFAALDEGGSLEDLEDLIEPEQVVIFMCSTPIEERPGWRSVGGMPIYQMVCRQPKLAAVEPLGRELGAADVPGMRALTKLTDPGPFLEETVNMGRYLGVEEGGELVAMAGERFRLNGWVEVSGVCTHPSAEGRGIAKALVSQLVQGMTAAGQIPFLHVRKGSPSEQAAIAAYLKLGFEHHQQIHAQAFVRE